MASPLRTLIRSLPGLGRVAARWALVAASAAAAIQPSAAGQAPAVDRAILTATNPLDAGQAAALKDFVTGWTADLGQSSDPDRITAARNALTDPARDPSASPIFRRAYSGAVLAQIRPIIEGKDLRRAINALQVARFLRSPESVDLIGGRLSPTTENDPAKRLSAASTLAAAVLDADLSPVQCDAITREIVASAAQEKDDQVLLQEMKVLGGIARRPGLPTASTEIALSGQVKVFSGLVQSVGAGPKADARMVSVAKAIVSLRNEWLELSRQQSAKLGPTLGPAIGKVLDIADRHWDTARGNPETKESYEIAVATGETLMRLVDRTLRPNAYPAPKPGAKDDDARVLASSWSDGQKEAFAAELKRWAGIVSAAPYTQN